MNSLILAATVTTQVIVVIVLVWLDRRLYNTWLTPFILLAVPVTVILVLTFTFAEAWGFVALDSRVPQIWMVALLFFWISSLAVLFPFSSRIRRTNDRAMSVQQEDESYIIVMSLSWLMILIVIVGLRLALSSAGGWAALGTESFRNIFSRGVFGHASIVTLAMLIYLIGSPRLFRPFHLLTTILICLLAVIAGVKSWLIIPVIAGLYYRISTKRLLVNLRLVVFVIGLGFVMLFSVYLLRMAVVSPAAVFELDTYTTLLRHLGAYLFAGMLGFGEFLKLPVEELQFNGLSALFAPFVNIFHVITFSHEPPVAIINPNYLYISPLGDKRSNVPTLVGTLWLYLGPTKMLIYIIGFSLVIHAGFMAGMLWRNTWILAAWCFVASLLSFSWFEMYFWHLTSIEIPIICFGMIAAVHVLTSSLRGKKLVQERAAILEA